VHHVAFSIENFERDSVEAELKRRGLDPRPDGPRAWTINDPAGYMIQVCDVRGVFPGAGNPGAKESDGLKNLDSLPKHDGVFAAYAVSHFVLNVPDVAKSRDFYMDLLGMQLVYYKPGDVAGVEHGEGPVCFLRFGKNTLYLRKSRHPEDRAYVSHFSPVVENFDQAAVKAQLERQGFKPRPDSSYAWTIADPAGMRIEVAGWGLPEHIGGDCNGGIGGCPGGRDS
jgi:catechol 2,3-dioxygenase-like lactoylglutathione lyase family enzyme